MTICENDALKMDYLSGNLSHEQLQELEHHFVDCPACREELAELRMLAEGLATLPQPSCPDHLAASASHRLSEYSRFRLTLSARRFAVASALVGAFGVLGVIVLQQTGLAELVETTLVALTDAVLEIFMRSSTTASLGLGRESLFFIVSFAAIIMLPSLVESIGFLVARRHFMADGLRR
jgi:anti-sigma factor RsiW